MYYVLFIASRAEVHGSTIINRLSWGLRYQLFNTGTVEGIIFGGLEFLLDHASCFHTLNGGGGIVFMHHWHIFLINVIKKAVFMKNI